MVKVSAISRDPLIDEFVEMAASARCHVPYIPQSYFVSGGPGNLIYTTSESKVGCEHALLAICDVLRGSSGMVNADAGSVLECTLCDFWIRVQADYESKSRIEYTLELSLHQHLPFLRNRAGRRKSPREHARSRPSTPRSCISDFQVHSRSNSEEYRERDSVQR